MPKIENPERENIFIDEYLKDFNGTRAAKTAGYEEKSAHHIASELLRKPEVQKKISDAVKARRKRLSLETDDIVKGLAQIGFFDIRKVFNEDGTLKKIGELTRDAAMAVKSVEVKELWMGNGSERVQVGVTSKIKFEGRTHALETLLEHVRDHSEGKNKATSFTDLIKKAQAAREKKDK